MLVIGTRVIYRGMDESIVHCERCGGDRPFRRRSGRRWAHLLGIPVYPLAATGEHLRCTVCRTCYRVELRRVPTLGQMQAALLAATTAAALTMLRAGDPGSPAARRQAADLISSAGSAEYDEDCLAADLANPGQGSGTDPRHGGEAGRSRPGGAGPDLKQAVEAFALQLEPLATEWFLAKVVQVGLADGPLSARQRAAIGTIAGYLGMSQARARDVILQTEDAAQAG
jgi:hypothetical protein